MCCGLMQFTEYETKKRLIAKKKKRWHSLKFGSSIEQTVFIADVYWSNNLACACLVTLFITIKESFHLKISRLSILLIEKLTSLFLFARSTGRGIFSFESCLVAVVAAQVL